MSKLILLAGACGVGKSTVLEAMRRKRLHATAYIEVDRVRSMYGAVDWQCPTQHAQALKHTAQLAESFMRDGYTVTIADTFSAQGIDVLLGCLAGRFVDRIFRLACRRPEVLVERMKGRPPGAFHDVGVSLALNAEHLMHPHIDTSDLSTLETAETVARMIWP